MIGPSVMMVTTTRMARTTTNTEQKESENWHLCLFMSLHDCLMNRRNFPQQLNVEPYCSSSSSYSYGVFVENTSSIDLLVVSFSLDSACSLFSF